MGPNPTLEEDIMFLILLGTVFFFASPQSRPDLMKTTPSLPFFHSLSRCASSIIRYYCQQAPEQEQGRRGARKGRIRAGKEQGRRRTGQMHGRSR